MATRRIEKMASEICLGRDETQHELRCYILRQVAFWETIKDPNCGEWDWVALKLGITSAQAGRLVAWATEEKNVTATEV